MKIAFIGNFSAEFSTENYHKKTFESLGHTVIQFQESDCRISQILSNDFDMLYWTHTHGWRIGSDSEVHEMFKTIKAKGIPSVGYHLDLWLGLQRERDLKTDPYWGIEHFFTCDKLMADYLTGVKGYFLPAGVYSGECFLGEPNKKKYPHEIIFTGSKGYHPEYPYRPKLIDWLHKTYGDRFAHYGGGGLPSVRGPELNNLYASAKIVMGDTLCKDFTYPYYTSDRLFETLGRGGFMIYPRITGLENFYEDFSEIRYYDYNDFKQLQMLIDEYLENDFEREAIRLAGFKRTISEHTYTHRLQTIIDTLW